VCVLLPRADLWNNTSSGFQSFIVQISISYGRFLRCMPFFVVLHGRLWSFVVHFGPLQSVLGPFWVRFVARFVARLCSSQFCACVCEQCVCVVVNIQCVLEQVRALLRVACALHGVLRSISASISPLVTLDGCRVKYASLLALTVLVAYSFTTMVRVFCVHVCRCHAI